jgi:hypothetical protein
VKRDAPFDLAALGVDHPHRRWQEACEELRRQADAERRAALHHWRRVAVLIRAQLAWERRGSPGWGPTLEDLREAALESAAIRERGAANG